MSSSGFQSPKKQARAGDSPINDSQEDARLTSFPPSFQSPTNASRIQMQQPDFVAIRQKNETLTSSEHTEADHVIESLLEDDAERKDSRDQGRFSLKDLIRPSPTTFRKASNDQGNIFKDQDTMNAASPNAGDVIKEQQLFTPVSGNSKASPVESESKPQFSSSSRAKLLPENKYTNNVQSEPSRSSNPYLTEDSLSQMIASSKHAQQLVSSPTLPDSQDTVRDHPSVIQKEYEDDPLIQKVLTYSEQQRSPLEVAASTFKQKQSVILSPLLPAKTPLTTPSTTNQSPKKILQDLLPAKQSSVQSSLSQLEKKRVETSPSASDSAIGEFNVQSQHQRSQKTGLSVKTGVTNIESTAEPSTPTAPPTEEQQKTLSLQQRVFAKLLSEPENNCCFDCGWRDPDYVSISNGIFLCFNCATGIHKVVYPVEVSYIKSIVTDSFTVMQLRVLINGGNKACHDYFENYDLNQESTQKKFNTIAAQYYRDRLKRLLEQTPMLPQFQAIEPTFEEGRERLKATKAQTPQVKPYSALNHREILLEVLTWESSPDNGREDSIGLLEKYDIFMTEKEKQNVEIHKKFQSAKRPKRGQQDPMLHAPDSCLPPFNTIHNEPYGGGENLFAKDFQGDEVIKTLNEFADSTYQFGEALFKRLVATEKNLEQTMLGDNFEGEVSESQGSGGDSSRQQLNESGSFSKRVKDGIQSVKVNEFKKGASERISNVGKSIWGYFTTKQ